MKTRQPSTSQEVTPSDSITHVKPQRPLGKESRPVEDRSSPGRVGGVRPATCTSAVLHLHREYEGYLSKTTYPTYTKILVYA